MPTEKVNSKVENFYANPVISSGNEATINFLMIMQKTSLSKERKEKPIL